MYTIDRRINQEMSGPSEAEHRKSTGEHFTPTGLSQLVARRLVSEIKQGGPLRILDPACGDGELLVALVESMPKNLLKNCHVVGIDTNERSLSQTKKRLQDYECMTTEFIHGDFLGLIENGSPQLTLFDSQTPGRLGSPFDVIIANPPYVRTQVLGAKRAQDIGKKFGLKGRVDLYQAFVVGMAHVLRTGGTIGIITSNRFLSVKAGATLRKFLARSFEIIEVVDLGDTKLFEAAVLPALFYGRKKGHDDAPHPEQRPPFIRVYEDAEALNEADTDVSFESICAFLEPATGGTYKAEGRTFAVGVGNLSVSAHSEEPWPMITSEERAWLDGVESGVWARFGDVAKVRVGVKTTADKVFIRPNWDSLPPQCRPEDETLRLLLSHRNAERWRSVETDETYKVLYTHTVVGGKRVPIELTAYPNAANYLESNRERLEGRHYVLKAKRQWYEIWVPQDPVAWSLPKVVFPDISPEPKFFYDPDGLVVDGNCYWLTLRDEQESELLFLLMALANSSVMTRYHELCFQNKLYAGRRRYLTQYVERYPIPDPTSRSSQSLIRLAKSLAVDDHSQTEQKKMENRLEILVAKGFGIQEQ